MVMAYFFSSYVRFDIIITVQRGMSQVKRLRMVTICLGLTRITNG